MGKKGKAQGRAGKKQKAKGINGSAHSTPRHNYSQYDDSDWDEDNRVKFKGFSGAKGKPAGFGTPSSANMKFRHQAISFVSAGVPQSAVDERNQRLDETDMSTANDLQDDDSDDDDNIDIDDSAIQTNIRIDADVESTEDGVANMVLDSSEVMDIDPDATTESTETKITVEAEPAREPSPEIQFMVDTVGDESLATKARSSKAKGKRPVREPSPARSDSSEEVVIFKGRSKATVVDDPFSAPPPARPQQSTTINDRRPRPSPHPTDDLLSALSGKFTASKPSPAVAKSTTSELSGWGSAPSKHDLSVRPSDEWIPAPDKPYWKNKKGLPRPDLGPTQSEQDAYDSSSAKPSKVKFADPKSSKSEMSAEDTIASLQSDWRTTLQAKKAAKKGGKADKDMASTSTSTSRSDRRGKRGRKKDNRALRATITSDEEDSDGEAAYDDYMQNLIAQMDDQAGDPSEEAFLANLKATATLSRPSLMVDGREVPDDELLKHMHVNDEDEGDTNGDWESVDDDSDTDGSSSINPDMDELSFDGLESELDYNEREMWEDEEDLRQRRRDMMTDEQIARLLAKQEEFGMDGDELMLDDGMYGSDDGFGDVNAARHGLSNLTNLAPGRVPNKNGMRKRARDKKNNFVSASLLADTVEQYGEHGFDIMDFERPSLRPLKKGRKGQLPAELETISDDDLKQSLSEQWNKDRSKKAQKKLEREELRREGLLGSSGKKGRSHLGTKYPLGMNMRQVHDELRDFLQDEELQQRSFPPMDKTDRAALHNICNALNLTSRSQGAGKTRFPVISKTSRTGGYSDEIFMKIIQASSRGFLSNRATAKKFAKKASKGPGRGGGFSKDAVTVRHGEVVGGAAPEISHMSFGAKLMAKHGWTKGMGLGKDNDGRTVPVEQIMRIGTAGLG
ncbi:putative G-patch domain, R3H domain, R3H domain superfamily protein [Septoria linicola]|nr:putative G-patch domain, R3H domain, R3H domain superfamily protein [Septoria linicola]